MAGSKKDALISAVVTATVILALAFMFRNDLGMLSTRASTVKFRGVELAFTSNDHPSPKFGDEEIAAIRKLSWRDHRQLLGYSFAVNCFGPGFDPVIAGREDANLVREGLLAPVDSANYAKDCPGVKSPVYAVRITPLGEKVSTFLKTLLQATSDQADPRSDTGRPEKR